MISSKETLKAMSREIAMQPLPETVEVGRRSKRIQIGIPRETSYQENRVALVPDSVTVLVNNGHEVLVETNAGKNANFSDREYSEAGATISYDRKKVFQCDLVLKVASENSSIKSSCANHPKSPPCWAVPS